MLKIWNMSLVTLTFLLTIFATFLTRSGLIESVLLKRGRSQLWIRKASTAVGTVGVAASVILCKPRTLFAFC